MIIRHNTKALGELSSSAFGQYQCGKEKIVMKIGLIIKIKSTQ